MLDIQTSNSVVADRVKEVIREKGFKQTALAKKKLVLHLKNLMTC